MSDRYVLVRVTDPDVTHLSVTHLHTYKQFADGSDIIGATDEHEIIPVPEDDQLTQSLKDAAIALDGEADNADDPRVKRYYQDAARGLRAWAGLDQEDDNE